MCLRAELLLGAQAMQGVPDVLRAPVRDESLCPSEVENLTPALPSIATGSVSVRHAAVMPDSAFTRSSSFPERSAARAAGYPSRTGSSEIRKRWRGLNPC